jgi:hypothetical protein
MPSEPKFVTRERRATPGIRALPFKERTANRVTQLRAAPPGTYAWREAKVQFSALAAGDADHLGRRILTDAGRANARYVARTAYRVYHARKALTERQWGLLEAAIGRTFEELEQWGMTATRMSRPTSVP